MGHATTRHRLVFVGTNAYEVRGLRFLIAKPESNYCETNCDDNGRGYTTQQQLPEIIKRTSLFLHQADQRERRGAQRNKDHHLTTFLLGQLRRGAQTLDTVV